MEIKKNIDFKFDVQNYQIHELEEINKFRKAYANGTFTFTKTRPFCICERGRARFIQPVNFKDRVPIHSFCKNILIKELTPFLIYDNGASMKNKGIDFALDRLETHLHKYYLQHKTNEGYMLKIDYQKYFDNLRHNKIIELIKEKIPDEEVISFLSQALQYYAVDVSYLDPDEYITCINKVYNSLEYNTYVSKELQIGEKFMPKSVGIGNEISQICGVYYLTKLDNYIKIVAGYKFYARYMDDLYIIHREKQALENINKVIIQKSQEMGLFINFKKTQIIKINKPFKFLKVTFIFTDTGKIIRIKSKDTFNRERIKIKKFKRMYEEGIMPYKDIENQYKSWRGSIMRVKNKHSKHKKYLFKNYRQISRMDKLYNELFIEPFIKGVQDINAYKPRRKII